jgi:hypothetical protein
MSARQSGLKKFRSTRFWFLKLFSTLVLVPFARQFQSRRHARFARTRVTGKKRPLSQAATAVAQLQLAAAALQLQLAVVVLRLQAAAVQLLLPVAVAV